MRLLLLLHGTLFVKPRVAIASFISSQYKEKIERLYLGKGWTCYSIVLVCSGLSVIFVCTVTKKKFYAVGIKIQDKKREKMDYSKQ